MGDLAWLTARPVAHRGLHDAARGIVENSAGAMDAAIAAGYPIELDLQASADGEAMVFHDFTLDRLTAARGAVAARTAAELREIALRGSGDTLLTLPELLARVAGRVPLVIEIKSAFSGDMRLAARAAELVAAYDGKAALMSFDPDQVTEVRARAPGVVRGIVAQGSYSGAHWPGIDAERARVLADMDHHDTTDYQFINYHFTDLERPAVLAAKAAGIPILAWTVRSPVDEARARGVADQIVFEGFRA
ncbi:glycerophosphodiester phosphodiesterase family protein [Xanthobacter sp. KR7-65]|uniref:glycerophosphodiester phosphodiesterase family protein n=1 Tax=Xanthobacter sp. KR7-65 TaxID=3156612 RepID=UPI0032B619BA